MIVRIQNKDGLFSTGGIRVRFTKKGKIWSSLGYVKSHFNQHSTISLRKIYNDCKIITIDDRNDYIKNEIPINDFINEYVIGKVEKDKLKELYSLQASKKHYELEIEKNKFKLSEIIFKLNNMKEQK